MEIFLEAFDLRVADVGAVEKREKVQQTKPWDELQVEPPQQFAILQRLTE